MNDTSQSTSATPQDASLSPRGAGLSRQALKVRLLVALVPVIVLTIVFALADLALWASGEDLPGPPGVVPLLVGLLIGVVVWQLVRRLWSAWRWELETIGEREVLIVSGGLWTHYWQAVPVDRVQFVETMSGPLQRSFELSSLVVRTAGVRTPAVVLSDLDLDVAQGLRERLAPTAG